MDNPIYEIYLKNIDKILVFCNEEDYKESKNRQMIFTDIYIYGDDTLIEVINKIKINIIKYIPLYKLVKFENIAGYLSADYDFYNNFTLQQYIYLNILNNSNDKITFINKLSFIDKQYTNESLLPEKIIYKNIDLSNIENINNELVIGYFDRNTSNNYTYNIGVNKMERLIDSNVLIENELNRPINHYVNYNNDYDSTIITKFNFTVVNNENFKKFNHISLPTHIEKDPNTLSFLENIYTSYNNNKLKLTKPIDNFKDILVKSINNLSLEIYTNKSFDLHYYFNTLKLNENFPMCILSYKEKKNKITYRLHKKNGIPYIKQNVFEDLTDKKKFIEKRNYLLNKVYFIKNNIKTDYLIDIYLIEDNYFFINFDFISNNINNVNIDDIIFNINNILDLLNLTIANNKKINNKNEFHYYNNKNIIKINNDNDYISSSLQLILNYDELKLPIPKNNIHKFINFLSIFTTIFDVYVDNLSVIYENKLYNVESINTDNIILKRKKQPIPLYDACTLTVKTSNITLYYKKSYNYESFNYLSKFFKHISTFNLKDLTFNYSCVFTTEKTQASFLEFLYYNNFEKFSDIYKAVIPDINFVLDNTPYKDKTYCEYIKRKNNQKTSLNINIDSDIFYINVKNIDNFNELNNLCNTFNNYIHFTNNYDITSINRLEFDNDVFTNNNDTIFNKYNNIYNVYNTLTKSSNNEYYLYLLYNSILKNTNIEKKPDIYYLDDVSISDSDSDSEDEDEDEEVEQVVIDETSKMFEINIDNNVEKFNNLNNYKSQFYNADKKDTMKLIFGDAYKLCNLERRPSILPSDLVNRILDKESKDKIIVNKVKSRYFTELFDFDNNIYNFTLTDKIKSDKSSFKMYMGRNYRFNLNYTTEEKNKLVILFNENNNYINDEGELNKDTYVFSDYENMNNSNVYLEIYLENNTKINFNSYLSDFENKNYYFKLNFSQNSVNNMYNNYVVALIDIENNTIHKIIKIDLQKPNNYYYDKYKYGDYYFMYLPGKSENTQKSHLHPIHMDNMICCFSTNPHINLDLSNNNKKKPYNEITVFSKEEDLKLDNFKISTIPKEIYTNIKFFLQLPDNDDYYKINKFIQPHQAYRFGLTYNSNINNLMFCIFNIIKLSNIKLNPKVKKLFKFDILDSKNIKKGLISCVQDIEILNKTALLRLNNNIYAKNTKAKALETIVNVFSKTTTKSLKTKNTHYNEIRDGLKNYIENNFTNLDINFIWNLCSLIFNINIIIFELTYTNVLSSSIKCPIVNNYNIYDFKNRDTCFILNFDNLYQPITIPTLASSSTFNYNLLFNFRNKDSILNLNNLFNKCLLRYNNNVYNTYLINSIYHKIDISNNIIIDTKEIYDLKDYIKYIVINTDYIKLGIIFEIANSKKKTKSHLFIPINYIKHNINYNIIEGDYKYIYKSKTETDEDFIHTYDDTVRLIKDFLAIHNNSKLNINDKYLTDGKNIIGIGLNIGDYIPIIPYDITEEEDDEFTEETILADISYLSHNIHEKATKEELYNKFEYTDLYYEQFLKSVQSKLFENKETIINLINTENKQELKNQIQDIIYDLFTFKEFMYLRNKKPTYNTQNTYKLCNTLETDSSCDNNCDIDNNKCKFIITEQYYNLFLDFVSNDLMHNHYKRNIILSKSSTTILDTLNNNSSIVLDYDTIDKYVINDLYNKILTDKEYYLTGLDYKKISSNSSKKDYDNNNYCTNLTYIDSLKLSYYEFKPLSKLNIISYSNCIYYNLGLHHTDFKNNYINNVRNSIGNKMKDLILDETFNLFDIINYYMSKNNSHLYTNIEDINDLFNLITSDLHWLTEIDLYLFSIINEKKIEFYKEDHTEDLFMVMNEQFKKSIKIFIKPFYYKNLYYLIKD